MEKIKSWYILWITLMMSLMLAGCGNSGNDPDAAVNADKPGIETGGENTLDSDTADKGNGGDNAQIGSEAEGSEAGDTDNGVYAFYEDVYQIAMTRGYDENGAIRNYCSYSYDESGNTLSETHYDASWEVQYETEWTYDGDGRVLSKTDYYGSDREEGLKVEYSYDTSGKPLRESYKQGGEERNRSEYEYDSDGRCVRITGLALYDGKSEVYSITEYFYDADGDLKTEEYSNWDGYFAVTEYDKKGNLVSVKRTNDGYYYHYECEYDEEGRVVKEVGGYSEDDSTIVESVYDDFGNCTEMIYYDGEGNYEYTSRTDYEYDENGNLTKEICYDIYGAISSMQEHGYIVSSVFHICIPEEVQSAPSADGTFASSYTNGQDDLEFTPLGGDYYRVNMSMYRLYGFEGVGRAEDGAVKITMYRDSDGHDRVEAAFFQEEDGTYTLEIRKNESLEYIRDGDIFSGFTEGFR